MFIARPTHGGVIFLLLACAAGGVAFMNVGLMTALCASLLAGIWISAFLMAQFSFLKVKVERISASDVPGNSDAVLPLKITNTSFFYRNVLIVREKFAFSLKKIHSAAVPPLAPGEVFVLNRAIHADIRGHFKLEKVTLISGDPCGFFKRSKTFELPGEITVTPRIEELFNLPVSTFPRNADGGEGRLLGRAGIGGDFFGIRPFRYGDDVKDIYWRGSAARNKLMVREFEASVTEKIHILLDCSQLHAGQDDVDSNFERLVSAAASVTAALSMRYCHLSFVSAFENSSRLCFSGESAGVAPKILEALTELRLCDCNIEELLCDLLEYIRPGETLFLMTMSSTPRLEELVSQLRDSCVTVNWLYAPACNFPPVEPDTLRELPRKSFPCTAEQTVINFKTQLTQALRWNDDLEKI